VGTNRIARVARLSMKATALFLIALDTVERVGFSVVLFGVDDIDLVVADSRSRPAEYNVHVNLA
jgi:hypothetical protein